MRLSQTESFWPSCVLIGAAETPPTIVLRSRATPKSALSTRIRRVIVTSFRTGRGHDTPLGLQAAAVAARPDLAGSLQATATALQGCTAPHGAVSAPVRPRRPGLRRARELG